MKKELKTNKKKVLLLLSIIPYIIFLATGIFNVIETGDFNLLNLIEPLGVFLMSNILEDGNIIVILLVIFCIGYPINYLLDKPSKRKNKVLKKKSETIKNKVSKKKNETKKYNVSNKLFTLYMISFIPYLFLLFHNLEEFFWILLCGVIVFPIYPIVLIFQIIFTIKKYNLFSSNQKIILKSIVIILLFLMIFPLFVYLEDYLGNKNNPKNAREQIIILLNKKYGDGGFNIVEMVEKNICSGCAAFSGGIDGYEFTISSNYLDNNFVVSLTKDNFEIYYDDFLGEYYYEKLGINGLDSYLENYKVEKLNKDISQNFNTVISFNNIKINSYDDKEFGKIPSIDELSNFVELYDPKFEIKDDLNTKEDLLNYLINLLKFYINDFDTTNIGYLHESKYFRYKYDYTKLGVNNYSDQYERYGGYVYAVNDDYEERKHLTENEDGIVRISIMGNTTTFNMQDILGAN